MKVSRDSGIEARKDWTGKMMELSCYDDNDNPIYGYDGKRISSGSYADRADRADNIPVFVQRIVSAALPMIISLVYESCAIPYHHTSLRYGPALPMIVSSKARNYDLGRCDLPSGNGQDALLQISR